MRQEFRNSLAGWFWFRVSHEIAVKNLVSAAATGSNSKVVPMGVAPGRRLSSSPWVGFCELSEYPHGNPAGFPQSK